MKAFALLALLALSGAADASLLARGSAKLSPVTRVVELMQDLSKKIEQESKSEQGLYETFVCWAQSMISQKTASNAASSARIEELGQYIADLDAGRIELTTERQDLEKEIEGLMSDIEVSTETRNAQAKDFEMAKDEMDKAIAALQEALEVLGTATEDHKTGVLLNMGLGEGAAVRAKQAALLRHAAELGDKVLTRGDATFLRRILTGEVPTPDWKKLNRKATFKKSYKARSFKIQGVLAKLLETFSLNLAKATEDEHDAVTLFDKLMESKGAEKDASTDALHKLNGEKGARGLSRAEAVAEKDKLSEEVRNDAGYLQQVKDALADKKAEWKDRTALRTAELAAISKAIEILHNDDAKDLFKKSYASQDQNKKFFFLQEGSSEQGRRVTRAVEELHRAAQRTKDTRLRQLAARLQSRGHFDEVIEAIDSMIGLLKQEEDKDLTHKEKCEFDRANNTRDAAVVSRKIDEQTDAIAVLKKEIETLLKQIEEDQKSVAAIQEQLTEAKEMRDKEHGEYLVAKKDDEDAAEVVLSAKEVLETFYQANFGLLQKDKKQPFASVAGEAPPPPPTTWDAPYAGSQGEAQGIVSLLNMLHEDIAKDIQKADTEEAESLDLYTKTKLALETEMGELNDQVVANNQTVGEKTTEVSDTEGEQRLAKGELGVIMEKIMDLQGGCEFFTINYDLRLSNRQIELDSLEKAKAILTGATFATPADPSRELKPGDALVQRPRTSLRKVSRHS